MGNLSEHFDKSEFRCQCGCGGENPSKTLISMLEKLFKRMDAKAIIISSGYRCPNYSVSVGGYRNDAHTQNIAADLCVKKQDGSYYSSKDVAEAAEREGFGGIGLIDNTYIHLDTRGIEPYVNNHWFGNEVTGENYNTFQRGTVFAGEKEEPKAEPKEEPQELSGITGELKLSDGTIYKVTLEKQ